MKISEAIEKALKENPNVQHISCAAFESIGNDQYCACAIGLALIGKLGLKSVIDIHESDDYNKDIYKSFNNEFNDDYSNIIYKNDKRISHKRDGSYLTIATKEETESILEAIREYEQEKGL